MFVVPSAWTDARRIWAKIGRYLTGNLLFGMPKGFGSLEEQREAHKQWLQKVTGKNDYHQTYEWGDLVLLNYREESYLFQVNYLNPATE